MNSTKLDVFLSALTAFCIASGGAIVTVVGSQAGGTTALNKTAWILAGALGLVAAAKDVRSLLKLPPVSLSVSRPVAVTAKAIVPLLAMAFLVGCVSATATRTGKDGSTSSIKVTGFLENVAGGNYTTTNSDGTATTLSIANATPDQQSIAILAGAVADIGKSAMLLAKQPTNNVIVLPTNSAATLTLEPPPKK
jgi:hypothetical protein